MDQLTLMQNLKKKKKVTFLKKQLWEMKLNKHPTRLFTVRIRATFRVDPFYSGTENTHTKKKKTVWKNPTPIEGMVLGII